MFSIVQLTVSDGGNVKHADAEGSKMVRSKAMQHFRREQRNARNRGKGQPRLLMPAKLVTKDCAVEQKSTKGQPREHDDVPKNVTKKTASQDESAKPKPASSKQLVKTKRNPPVVPQIHAPTTLTSTPNNATYNRSLLGALFGASLTGSPLSRPHSPGIRSYRGWVASTKSDMVLAIDDTLCLCLPACSLADPRILADARKRHLAGVQCMRRVLRGDDAQQQQRAVGIAGRVSAALEILFVNMFAPFAVPTGPLYEGLVHLVRVNWRRLTTFQDPAPMGVVLYLLFNVQPVMLLVSLDQRVGMPIDAQAWKDVPHASGVRADITESLMPLAIEVPGLLEEAQTQLQGTAPGELKEWDVLTKILILETRLVQWREEWLPRPSNASADELSSLSFLSKQCLILWYICTLQLHQSAASLDAALPDTDMESATQQATWICGRLCDLAEHFIEHEDGLLGKALSVCPALHFARRWYASVGDGEGVAAVEALERRVRLQVPFLAWQAVLPLGLLGMFMVGQ